MKSSYVPGIGIEGSWENPGCETAAILRNKCHGLIDAAPLTSSRDPTKRITPGKHEGDTAKLIGGPLCSVHQRNKRFGYRRGPINDIHGAGSTRLVKGIYPVLHGRATKRAFTACSLLHGMQSALPLRAWTDSREEETPTRNRDRLTVVSVSPRLCSTVYAS